MNARTAPAPRRARSAPKPPAADALPADEVARTGNALIDLISLQWQRERSDLDLSDFLLAIYCMRLGTYVDRAYSRNCQRRYGFSGSDMRVLLALRRSGPPYVKRPTDLFKALLVTSGAMTKKVDRLSTLGMVERLPDPGYTGGFLVHLTRLGLQTVDEATEWLARESVLAPAMEQFTAAERQAGTRFVLRTLAALESTLTADDVGAGDEEADVPKPKATARVAAKKRASPTSRATRPTHGP